MAKNGERDEGQGLEASQGSPFGPLMEDFDLESLVDIYVGFEQLMGILLWAAAQQKLNLYNISTQIDTTTLERSFEANAVPADWELPYSPRAKLSFSWPAEYTSLSVYSDEALCSLYHDESEFCTHEPGSAEMFVELEIDYVLPSSVAASLDSDEGIEKTARQLRQAFIEEVNHDNIVHVWATAHYGGDQISLTEIKAHYYWTLEEELHNLPLLAEVLMSICAEVRRVLIRLRQEFPPEENEL